MSNGTHPTKTYPPHRLQFEYTHPSPSVYNPYNSESCTTTYWTGQSLWLEPDRRKTESTEHWWSRNLNWGNSNDIRIGNIQPCGVGMVHEVAPALVAFQSSGVADDDEGALRAGEAHVDPALICHEPDGRLHPRTDRGKQRDFLLAPLHTDRRAPGSWQRIPTSKSPPCTLSRAVK